MVSTQQLSLQDKAFLEGRQDWVPLHSLPGFQTADANASAKTEKPLSKPMNAAQPEERAGAPLPSAKVPTSQQIPNESPKSKSSLREVKLASPQSVPQKPKPTAPVAAPTAATPAAAPLKPQTALNPANAALPSTTSFNEAPPNELWSSLNKAPQHHVVLKPLGSANDGAGTPPPATDLDEEAASPAPALKETEALQAQASAPAPAPSLGPAQDPVPNNVIPMNSQTSSTTPANEPFSNQVLQLVNGRAVLTLEDLKMSGEFELQLDSEGMTEVGHAAIAVQAGQVAKIELSLPEKATVGEKILAQAIATDQFGNTAAQFDGTLEVEISGSATCNKSQKFQQGCADIELTNKVAENVELRIISCSVPNLSLPTKKLTFVAGPAVKLVVVTPESAVAGEKVKVEVQAVDQFGNLSDNHTSKLSLKIIKKSA